MHNASSRSSKSSPMQQLTSQVLFGTRLSKA
jgi:hypothetical protein